MKKCRNGVMALLTAVLLAFAGSSSTQVRAAEETTEQIVLNRAHDFLKTEKRGKYIISYTHFGANYTGHSYSETREVLKQGQIVPGHFALVYTFTWGNDGWTDIAFLCDARGKVYGSTVVGTNAILQQPYGLANATIQVLGNLTIEVLKDQIKPEDRKKIQTFVDSADAKGLMEFGLALQQAFGT